MDKVKLGIVIAFGMVIPGLLFGFISATWKAWVVPFTAVPLGEILNQPVLNIIQLIAWFLGAPSACILALAFIVAAFKIWFD